MTKPVVSVLMPSLNQAEFIGQAIRSVMEQDFTGLPVPVELVVADGGSTDGTVPLLRELEAEYGPCLRWQSAPDAGPAAAVNKALGRSVGDIIGWLNADDLYAPGAIASAICHFQTRPDLLMVYGEAERMSANGFCAGRWPTRPPDVGLEGFRQGNFICQPAVFLRRSVFIVGGLDETLAATFDVDLWMRIFRQFQGNIAHVPALWALARRHPASISHRLRDVQASEYCKLVKRHLNDAFLGCAVGVADCAA